MVECHGSRISSDLLSLRNLNRRRVLYAPMEIYIVPFFPRLITSIATHSLVSSKRGRRRTARYKRKRCFSFRLLIYRFYSSQNSLDFFYFIFVPPNRETREYTERDMLNSGLVQRILDNNEGGRGGMEGERKSFARDSSARARRGGRGWSVNRKAVVKS